MKPKVSIITPVHNAEKFILATINSVRSQTVNYWQLIIIDDFSSDNTLKILESFMSIDSRIKLVRLDHNVGAAVARNKGIEVSKGRYIAFLDSDDQWLPNKLEKQILFMEKHQYSFTYTAYNKINEQGELLGSMGIPDKVAYFDLLKTNSIGCLTAIYDTKSFGKIYMPLIRKRQDFGLWLKLLKKTEFAYGLNENLALYRVRGDSISSNKLNTAGYTWRLFREVEKLSLLKSVYYFMHYAIRAVLRSKFPKLAVKLGVLQ